MSKFWKFFGKVRRLIIQVTQGERCWPSTERMQWPQVYVEQVAFILWIRWLFSERKVLFQWYPKADFKKKMSPILYPQTEFSTFHYDLWLKKTDMSEWGVKYFLSRYGLARESLFRIFFLIGITECFNEKNG